MVVLKLEGSTIMGENAEIPWVRSCDVGRLVCKKDGEMFLRKCRGHPVFIGQSSRNGKLVGGLEHVLFSHLLGC